MRRSLVRVLVGAVALAIILVAADLGARRYALDRVAEGVQQEYGLTQRPDVAVAGGSFLLQVLRGDVEDVTVRIDDLPAGDLTVSDVRVRVPHVAVPTAVLVGRPGTIDLSAGTLRGLVPFDSLAGQVSVAGLDVSLGRSGDDVRADAEVAVLGFDVGLALTVEPQLQDGSVLMVPLTAELAGREVPLSRARALLSAAGFDAVDGWSVPLEEVPGEVEVQSLSVTDAGIGVRGALLATSVDVG